jgi:hypothetical protein
MAFRGGSSFERTARPGLTPAGWAGSAPTRRVWPVMDDIERGAIPAEGVDPQQLRRGGSIRASTAGIGPR